MSRTEKEKAKFQQEVYELLAQIESSSKERVSLIFPHNNSKRISLKT